ncbi:MAG: hypothetical protein CME64_11790 [Halobacteriovoraceae bacterium]|nr:hypothetical protein [Halobacteriovoraceae bacterium]|tara:strand:+ start:105759 stop:106235 length:477 start_codon:yes stop_codon:yes gene_type:complete
MKILLAAIAVSLGASASHHHDWLLSKTTGGGFVIPELARTETCKIFEGKKNGHYKVKIKKTFGELEYRKIKHVYIRNLEEAISASFQENLVSTANPVCDAPETTVKAQLPGELGELTIFFTGGCGTDELERTGANSQNLRGLISEFCPTTIDFDPPVL